MQNLVFERARPIPGRRLAARPQSLRRASLLIGTSLLLHSAPAWAVNECGPPPPGGGTVTCPAGVYPGGIDYATPADLEILLEPGVVTLGNSSISTMGDLRIVGEDNVSLGGGASILFQDTAYVAVDEVFTSLDSAPGLRLAEISPGPTPGQLAEVSANTVTTSGESSSGIYIFNGIGDVSATVGSIMTSGLFSRGIEVFANGHIFIDIGSLETTGDVASGITAQGGSITIRSGTITAAGDGLTGISASNFFTVGDVEITSGSIAQSGDFTLGIGGGISIEGDVNLISDSIVGTGMNSSGINIGTVSGDVTITSRIISVQDYGLRSSSANGDVRIVSDTVTTRESESIAIAARTAGGSLTVESGRVETTGDDSIGIRATRTGAGAGSVTVDSGRITTAGVESSAIVATAEASGDIEVTSDSIATSGDNARGISASASSGNVTVVSGEVTTLGQNAFGIDASSNSGNVSVTSGSVEVSGNTIGIVANTQSGAITIDAETVTAAGNTGILAASDSGAITVTADNVEVHGVGAPAISATSFGTVRVNSGSVATTGERSDGIDARGSSVTVVSDEVETTGAASVGIRTRGFGSGGVAVTSTAVTTLQSFSDAISASSLGGSVTVTSDRAETKGDNSVGIRADSELASSVTSGTIITAGNSASGIVAEARDVQVRSGSITTAGQLARGITTTATTGSTNIISSGVITTTGGSGTGILALSLGGISVESNIDVRSETITTSGDNSAGISAYSPFGDVTIASRNLTTSGQGLSTGIDASSQDGDVRVGSAMLQVSGNSAAFGDLFGISARSRNGSIQVTSGILSTSGTASYGIYADSVNKPVFVGGGTTSTMGDFAGAILALSNSSNVRVESGSASTAGTNAIAIQAWANDGGTGSSTVIADETSTLGPNSHAISARSFGHTEVTSNLATTAGDDSNGIVGITFGGDLIIRSGAVSTAGLRAFGIRASATGSGDVTVTSGDVATQGSDSAGIFADAEAGTVTVTSSGTVSTTGDNSSGIDVFADGSAHVKSADVTTSGNDSPGIDISVGPDSQIDIESGTIGTAGNRSPGINAIGGTVRIDSGSITTTGESIGINATATTGDVSVTSGAIVTGGAGSSFSEGAGIAISAFQGNISVVSGSVTTTGTQAFGIFARASEADVNVVSETIATSGRLANAIFATSFGGSVTVTSGPISTLGDSATGVVTFMTGPGATSIKTGSITTQGFDSYGVIATSIGTGPIDVQADGTIVTTGPSSPGISAETGGQVTVSANNVSASGANSDAIAVKGSTSNVTIRGLVQSSQGFAVRGEGGLRQRAEPGGPVTVDILAGAILRGRVSFTSGGDRIDNSGLFDALGTSEFGAGSDLFANLAGGVLRSVNGPSVMAGLESFTNGGRIEMRDGASGDSLTLTGAYSGLAGGRLGLDVNLTDSTADRLVTGAATGSTLIDLATSGTSGFGSILLVDAGAGTSATAFSLAAAAVDSPYLVNRLRFDSANNDFLLVQGPGAAVFETVRFAAMATNLWYESADAVAAQLDTARDGRGGRGIGLWLQAWTGKDESEGLQSFGGETFDVSFREDFQGLQGGLDLQTGPVAIGITGGAGRSDAAFLATGNPVDMEVRNIGAYVQGHSGPIFFNALAKYDWAELEIAPGAGLGASFDADSFGVQANAGVRLAFGSVFAEPSVGLSWVQTEVDAFASGPATVGPGEGESLRARAGLRVGAKLPLGGGALLPFVAVNAYEELSGENGSDFTLGETLRLFDEPAGTRGQAAAGVSFVAGRFEAFVRGDMDFSGESDAKSVRAGARLRF